MDTPDVHIQQLANENAARERAQPESRIWDEEAAVPGHGSQSTVVPMDYHTQSQDISRLSNTITGPSRRPAMISELTERANIPWDKSKGFKYHLKLAEKYRREGKEYERSGDMENAFVEFAKAASLVLELLPEHPDYFAKLKPNQRDNLRLVCPVFYFL